MNFFHGTSVLNLPSLRMHDIQYFLHEWEMFDEHGKLNKHWHFVCKPRWTPMYSYAHNVNKMLPINICPRVDYDPRVVPPDNEIQWKRFSLLLVVGSDMDFSDSAEGIPRHSKVKEGCWEDKKLKRSAFDSQYLFMPSRATLLGLEFYPEPFQLTLEKQWVKELSTTGKWKWYHRRPQTTCQDIPIPVFSRVKYLETNARLWFSNNAKGDKDYRKLMKRARNYDKRSETLIQKINITKSLELDEQETKEYVRANYKLDAGMTRTYLVERGAFVGRVVQRRRAERRENRADRPSSMPPLTTRSRVNAMDTDPRDGFVSNADVSNTEDPTGDWGEEDLEWNS